MSEAQTLLLGFIASATVLLGLPIGKLRAPRPGLAGTAVGRQFPSASMGVSFLTLAVGSILYVVIQLLDVARKSGRKELLYWGVLLGLAAGFVTDMIVTAGGA